MRSPVGAGQIISDYFDHGQISGYFISADDPAAYDPTLIPDGKVFEDGLQTIRSTAEMRTTHTGSYQIPKCPNLLRWFWQAPAYSRIGMISRADARERLI